MNKAPEFSFDQYPACRGKTIFYSCQIFATVFIDSIDYKSVEKSTLNVESIDPQSKSYYYDINSHTLSLRDYLGVFFVFFTQRMSRRQIILIGKLGWALQFYISYWVY